MTPAPVCGFQAGGKPKQAEWNVSMTKVKPKTA
jgi:hypothetical protein